MVKSMKVRGVKVKYTGCKSNASIGFSFKSKTAGTTHVNALVDKDYRGRVAVVDMMVHGTKAEASSADDRRADKIVAAARKRLPVCKVRRPTTDRRPITEAPDLD